MDRFFTNRVETPRQKAASFLRVADDFKLGSLPTEQRHPLTHQLADLARHDVASALGVLKEIDAGVVAGVMAKEP